eukprot:TRINITY_DN9430_c0_g1_i1.p1 TRINITY_DN9430_c0_g1~~TRINITY_DN9430_c0_g1_i1.p1  ORF type:complete len:356 (+),score=81.30 TRINITY_DN9430_c0_g1_i1:64-1068(+)
MEEQIEMGGEPAKQMVPSDDLPTNVLVALTKCIAENKTSPEDLKSQDFLDAHKYKIAGDPSLEVKDYTPAVFQRLRQRGQVTDEEYLHSWSNTKLSSEKSAGKSDSVFLFSPDRQFVLKTISREESKWLRSLTESMYNHLMKNPNSLLNEYFGHHRLVFRRKKIHFVVMANIFKYSHNLVEMYDLKGSSVGREVPEEKRKKGSVLKDNDLLRLQHQFHFPQQIKHDVFQVLAQDCHWLCDHARMDYSFLVGVEEVQSDVMNIKKGHTEFDGGIASEDGKFIYYLGIIDFLQKYNTKKKLAGAFKSLRHKKEELSTVEPAFYSNRFQKFLEKVVD